ncbi:hypothetical protein BDR07DRAFT_1389554 [Suillus spraguei]|nr:hypothetical protein BDR07DRAFT_1389554 [Suillus spraguei]
MLREMSYQHNATSVLHIYIAQCSGTRSARLAHTYRTDQRCLCPKIHDDLMLWYSAHPDQFDLFPRVSTQRAGYCETTVQIGLARTRKNSRKNKMN